MPITRLSLTDFRSYADLLMHPGPGLNVLTGENGAGKTNILEAVSLLAPGRGLRGAALSEMARRDSGGGFGVSAFLEPLPFRGGVGVGTVLDESERTSSTAPTPNPSPEGEGLIALGTGTLASAPERRLVRVNGVAAPAAALAEWLSLVWLSPAQDRLFTGPAGERRRFLDRLVLALDATHARDATRYEAAMRQRNRLLADDAPDREWLSALEAAMVQHGLAIAARRADLVERLSARLAAAPAGPFARASLALGDWEPSDFARHLRDGRARDRAAGRTLAGPHRQDLAVTHLEKASPAAQASTGEQKALLIGIVLAHADLVADALDRRPVLLLDEVAAHLDPRRRAALFDRLAAGGGQVWLTGTEPSLFDGAIATRFTVADGSVSP